MAFKPSYNIMDRDTHNALVNAFKTGGIAYTDDDGTVHKISDDYVNASGGGSDLPEVTSADAGKVLAVNASGEWAAESVYFRINDNEGVLDKTADEIDSALRAGKYVFIVCVLSDSSVFHQPVVECQIDESGYSIFSLASASTPLLYVAVSANDYPILAD